jgi:outer membrane immunogenic protein
MFIRKFTLSLVAAAATSFAGAAYAADVYEPPAEPAPAYVPAPAAFSWTGIYFGVNGGYGWGTATDLDSGFNNDTSPSGWLAGGQIGANYQFAGGLLLGAEVAWDWANLTDTLVGTVPFDYTVTTNISSIGSVAGRIGYAMDRWLVYARGGWAWAGSQRIFDPSGGGYYSDNQTLSGWTAGLGVEYAFTNNLIGRLQVDHYQFNNAVYELFNPVTVATQVNTVTAGVSLKF